MPTKDNIIEFAKHIADSRESWLNGKDLEGSDLVRQYLFGRGCIVCDCSPTSFHEIQFKSTHPKTWMQFNNGVPLCIGHHTDAHNARLSKKELNRFLSIRVCGRFNLNRGSIDTDSICSDLDGMFGF